jgi:hypothetical protein
MNIRKPQEVTEKKPTESKKEKGKKTSIEHRRKVNGKD